MNNQQNSCPRIETSRLLEMLQSEDVHQQYEALLVACPCRNRYYDREIWQAVCRIRANSPDPKARDRANHVMVTLAERTRFDLRSLQMLRWLAEQGFAVFIPPWLRKEVRQHESSSKGLRLPKVIVRDVPTLVEALASEDPDEQAQVLQVLCPGRARQYHKKVWLAFFYACHGAYGVPEDQALLATRRLLEHAREDPSAQETLRWLYHELCAPANAGLPADTVDALLETLGRPLYLPVNARQTPKVDPALRGAALVEVDPLIEAVRASRNPRELRKALYALRKTEDPCALSILAEYVHHPDPAVSDLAKSLLTPHTQDARTVAA